MKTLLSLWRGPIPVPRSLPEIAAEIALRYRVGIRDLRAPTRGPKNVCEARRVFIGEAAADGHQHKVIAAYLNRCRSGVTHHANQWDAAARAEDLAA